MGMVGAEDLKHGAAGIGKLESGGLQALDGSLVQVSM
jgi:hypothetical protein